MTIKHLVIAIALAAPLTVHAAEPIFTSPIVEPTDMPYGYDQREGLRKSWETHKAQAIKERDTVRLQSNLIQAKHLQEAIRNADARAQMLIKEITAR